MPPASRVRAFLLVFAILFLSALALVIAAEFSDVKWIRRVVNISEGLGRLTFVAIATTFILVEGVPMLASWLRKSEIKEAKEEGRTEGLAKGRALQHQAWLDWMSDVEAWEQEKAAAEKEGREVTTPRPTPPTNTS